MFSITNQNQQKSAQSSLQAKKQNFRNEIRRRQLDSYRSNIRKKLFYDNEVNFNLLKNIDLKQTMEIILQYQFPKEPIKGGDFEIDESRVIYDLERPENQKLKIAIEELFLYITSSMSSHVTNLLQQRHIFIIIEIIERKTLKQKPRFRQKSYKQQKKADNLFLPQIYQKMLIILTHWSFDSILTFQESIKYIVHLYKQLLSIFPTQTRVVTCCCHSIMSLLDTKYMFDHLMAQLNDQRQDNCFLSKVLMILQHEIKFYDRESYHSNTVIRCLLNFYQKLFMHTGINDIFPNMRRRIYDQFNMMLQISLKNDQFVYDLIKTLFYLYNHDFGNISQILLETEEIFEAIIYILKKYIMIFKKKQAKECKQEKMQTTIYCFEILKVVFDGIDPQYDKYEEINECLSELVKYDIDIILQEALKLTETQIVKHSLQLIRIICNWGDFIQQIYENYNILARLFYFCGQQNISIKKEAICCICNIIEGYFEENNYLDAELCEIYEQIVERFDFLDVLVQNIDRYSEVQLNLEMLKNVRILSNFWKTDPELQRQNIFWMKFVQNGGELKLNTIVTSDRNEQMQSIAMEILNSFVTRQIQI